MNGYDPLITVLETAVFPATLHSRDCLSIVKDHKTKNPPVQGGSLNPVNGWTLPAHAAPRIGGLYLDHMPRGADERIEWHRLPFALRLGFGESQHVSLWSRRLDFNQRCPAYRAGALNTRRRRRKIIVHLPIHKCNNYFSLFFRMLHAEPHVHRQCRCGLRQEDLRLPFHDAVVVAFG